MNFLDCGDQPIGIYPLVSRAEQLAPLLEAGISTLQLRIKDLANEALAFEIRQAVDLCRAHGARLFINDYWQLAIKYHAYGVHLGQEDLVDADLSAIQQAGLRLGVSTHNPDEIESVIGLRPSYIAIGPIFATQSKTLNYDTVGLAKLQQWTQQLPCPVVAIGGIGLSNLKSVVQAGVSGIAMISGLQQAELSLEESASLLQAKFNLSYVR